MKYINSLFLLLIILASCGGEEKTGFTVNAPEQNDDTISQDIDLLEEEVEELEYQAFFIEDMPEVFMRLTENTSITENDLDEGYAIYKYCFSELPQIWFTGKKGDEWILTVLYGQDSEDFELTGFDASIGEQELFMVVNGSFNLKSLYDDTNTKTVVFWWNQDTNFACFEGVYDAPFYCVPEEDKSEYEYILEECEEPY